jgi:epoxyqueuosine reductase
MSCNDSLEARLKARALAEGFSDCRITSADARPDLPEKLAAWLNAGRHGDMAWMDARSDERADPAVLWPDVRSVIMLGMSYAPADDPMLLAGHPEKARFSVYARGRDYHDVVKRALKALARWLAEESGAGVKVFVDTAPVMEKPLAEAAGLGWQGKHTNVVSQSAGSWLFLGAIYTTATLANDTPGRDRCGSCTACQDICPTAAFPKPYQLDARRCISYLTIEHDGPIDAELRPLMGNHVYGCDDCLAVCPWNKFASAAQANRAFLPRAELTAPDLADLLALDDATFRQVFSGSPIKRSGRRRIVRNAAIAAGNSGLKALVPPVIVLLDDTEPQVRGAAIWALGRLDPKHAAWESALRAALEADPSVRAEWDALSVAL